MGERELPLQPHEPCPDCGAPFMRPHNLAYIYRCESWRHQDGHAISTSVKCGDRMRENSRVLVQALRQMNAGIYELPRDWATWKLLDAEEKGGALADYWMLVETIADEAPAHA